MSNTLQNCNHSWREVIVSHNQYAEICVLCEKLKDKITGEIFQGEIQEIQISEQ